MFRPYNFFREKDDGAGGQPPAAPATPPAPPPTSGGTPEMEKDGKAVGDEIKMSPAALKERLERAENSAQATLAKTLGYESVEAMKASVKDGQKALREKLTEQERIKADLDAAQKLTTEANERATRAETQATQARLEAEALSLMAGKFANPRAALKLMDLTSVTLTDPKFPGLSEAVEKLAKDEPWTLAPTTPAGKKPMVPNLGPTNPESNGKPAKTDEDRRKRYFGGGVQNSGFFQGGGIKTDQGKGQRIGGGG